MQQRLCLVLHLRREFLAKVPLPASHPTALQKRKRKRKALNGGDFNKTDNFTKPFEVGVLLTFRNTHACAHTHTHMPLILSEQHFSVQNDCCSFQLLSSSMFKHELNV